MVEERTGDFYTTAEAARILRISAQRVRKLIADGKLEAERVDDQWHIHAWSVHERMGERPPRRALRALDAPETPSELVGDVRGDPRTRTRTLRRPSRVVRESGEYDPRRA